jgi:uncharacterized protein (DUF983 family)
VKQSQNSEGRPGIVQVALHGLCPECGAKTLFAGTARFAERCGNCGLNYEAFNVGDGPAALLTLIIGALVIVMAITVDVAFNPPFWVQALIWVPVTVALTFWSLRVSKAALLAAEYRNKAGEAGMDDLS